MYSIHMVSGCADSLVHLDCFGSVLVFYSAVTNYNKQWFKTIKIYYLILLYIRSVMCVSLGSDKGAGRAAFLSGSLGKNVLLCVSQLLGNASFHWLMAPCKTSNTRLNLSHTAIFVVLWQQLGRVFHFL